MVEIYQDLAHLKMKLPINLEGLCTESLLILEDYKESTEIRWKGFVGIREEMLEN